MIVICLCVARKMAERDIAISYNNSNVRSCTYLRYFEHMRTGALDTTSSVHWALAFFAALLRVETQPEEEKKQTGSAVCIRRCRQIILFFISDSLVLVGGIMSLKVNWIIKCVNLVLNLRACFSCHDACRHAVLHVVGHCSHFAYLVVAFSIKKKQTRIKFTHSSDRGHKFTIHANEMTLESWDICIHLSYFSWTNNVSFIAAKLSLGLSLVAVCVWRLYGSIKTERKPNKHEITVIIVEDNERNV